MAKRAKVTKPQPKKAVKGPARKGAPAKKPVAKKPAASTAAKKSAPVVRLTPMAPADARIRKSAKASALAAIRPQVSHGFKLNLEDPKECAVLDVLTLAMASDGDVSLEETALVVHQVQRMLGGQTSPHLAESVLSYVAATIAETARLGPDVIIERSAKRLETEAERQMLFALASAVTCVDGVVFVKEAEFLVKLRSALGLTEAAALAGIAGVSRTIAVQVAQRRAG